MTNDAVLAVWTDVASQGEVDFNDWYLKQHVPERVDVPGFLAGNRYSALAGRPRYFAWYPLRNVDVLTSPAYRTRLDNPTDWTRRVMPHFRATIRSGMAVRHRLGRGRGGVAATIQLTGHSEGADDLVAWLVGEALPRTVLMPCIVGAQVWELVPGAGGGATTEAQMRGTPDRLVERAILVEGGDAASVRSAVNSCLPPAALAGFGAEGRRGLYRLLYTL
ncbi:MAG: hypothetical protein EXQ87_13650 [Alphaproteobacteria bacterium]|nr:hypothetical protein [Alphaproteobacteria bacterium]